MPERRAPSVIGQILMTFCANSGGYFVAIITGIVVARTLGPAGKGIVSYAALLLSLFTTFGVGLQSAVLHECGRGQAQQRALAAALRLLGITALPAAGLLLLVALLFPQHASFVYVACAIPFAVYCQTANAVFLLNNDVRTTLIQALIMTVGVAVFTIPALTFFHGGLHAALTVWSAMFVVAAVFTIVRLRPYGSPIPLDTEPPLVRDEAIFALKSGASGLAAFLNLRIDVFVVSLMLDARSLGIYSLAVATGEMMWQVSRPLVWTTIGRIAAAERARAIELTNIVTRNTLAIECVLGSIVFLAAPWAVRLVYGEAYAESAEVMRWLLPGMVVYATTGPLSYFVSVKGGRPTVPLIVQSMSVVACAGMSFLTIRWLGMFGAALATTVTYCCATVVLALCYARQSGSPLGSIVVLQPVDLNRLGGLVSRLPALRSRPVIAE